MSKSSVVRRIDYTNWGPEIVVDSKSGTDWKLKVDSSVQIPQDLKQGDPITFDWQKRTENGYDKNYITRIVSYGGAAPPANANPTNGASYQPPQSDDKNRHIFLCGFMNNVMHGAAAAGLNPNQAYEWLLQGIDLWNTMNGEQRPGDVPRNPPQQSSNPPPGWNEPPPPQGPQDYGAQRPG